MKLHFSKKEKMILLLVALLLILAIVFAQFVLLYPLKSDLEIKEQRLATQQKLLDALNNKNESSNAETVTAEETREIQKKVPVKPMQEQFILDLEKAETISNSKIVSMTFSAAGDSTTETGTEQTPEATSETETNTATGEASEQQTAQDAAAANALKKLTVNLGVESPSYEELEKFIDSLESLKRIVVVEAINYSSGEEITSVDQKDEPIKYTLTISAYYLPELNDLLAELPKIDAPAPANKDNPLSTFSETIKVN